MTITERIFIILAQKKLSQKEFARKIDVNEKTVSAWKKNNSLPPLDKISNISDCLDVSIDFLITGQEKRSSMAELTFDEQILLNNFKKLSDKSKGMVLGKAETLVELECKEDSSQQKDMITILSSDYRVSAGRGVLLDEESPTEITVPDTPEARKADFALTICGDSMEPIYHDGDVVLVRKMPSVEVGEIGIFYVDGGGYIKKYGGDRLISLNSAYDDILLNENTEIRCFGKVIGRA